MLNLNHISGEAPQLCVSLFVVFTTNVYVKSHISGGKPDAMFMQQQSQSSGVDDEELGQMVSSDGEVSGDSGSGDGGLPRDLVSSVGDDGWKHSTRGWSLKVMSGQGATEIICVKGKPMPVQGDEEAAAAVVKNRFWHSVVTQPGTVLQS